ncbi:ATP-dependent DNA helicase DDX31-like [Maniola hyperantus]|uniref:ATP-dependent DNA helicase DDX31-like n=1 Tax=Aphantopus hyperantus TaxID=2795564 RepID=UPI00374996AE
MSDQSGNEIDESALLSADRTSNGEFFIDDYSHLRLSYYQYRDNISLNVSDSTYQDSAYSTNASTNESYHEKLSNSTNASTDVSCRENKDFNNTTLNSTNGTNSQVLNEEEQRNATHESCRQIKDSNTTKNSTSSSNGTNSKVLNEEERRKLREYLVSQIPDLPHPSYTAASIIASASHRMDPSNRFVYSNRIEQGNRRDEDFEMETFTPERRSTLKPDTKL